ncbi:S49 family peptidase [Gordonibacter sp. Marseille-P4307]|uniref:S49 family peptidase n=1 Tax=Gordonibacter sp. Marseille-P4307 TaxID=2161815 RepID=UPI000F5203B9|nr:S49 family peptidase [Gordonibacter sp. Marseille-P4307]
MAENLSPEPPRTTSFERARSGAHPVAPPFAAPASDAFCAPQNGFYGAARPNGERVGRPSRRRFALAAVVAVVLAFIVTGIVLLANVLKDADSISGDAVALISVDGAIGYNGTSSSPEGLKSLLDRAEDDDRIKAVVLRVNSGGGTATAGEEMAQYVRQFSKPIVVSSAAINASAAYELSAMSDYIFVAKTTEIGAIGTVMQVTDLSEVMDKLGISVDSIKSAPSKDSSYGFRPLTAEEKTYYQALVDEINATFIENVAQGRGLSLDYTRSIATGLPFAGTTAVENGVADEVGTLEDAQDYAAQAAGIPDDYQVIDLEVPPSRASLLSLLMSGYNLSASDLTTILEEQTTHGIIAR